MLGTALASIGATGGITGSCIDAILPASITDSAAATAVGRICGKPARAGSVASIGCGTPADHRRLLLVGTVARAGRPAAGGMHLGQAAYRAEQHPRQHRRQQRLGQQHGIGQPDASAAPAKIAFSDCSSQFQTAIGSTKAKKMDFSCGKLAVPLDYASRPARPSSCSCSRCTEVAAAADRIGSLLVNPGGPGGSGVNLAAGLVDALSDDIFHHFDLVGFDPRGVGPVRPAAVHHRRAEGPAGRRRPGPADRRRPGRRPGPARAGGGAGLRGQVRQRARALQHRRDRARHGPDPAGGRRQQAELPRLLLRHPARRGLRPPVPALTSGPRCWTARWTRWPTN